MPLTVGVSKLFTTFTTLARNSGIGHKRPDLTKHAILFWPVETY
jgi:hypothetical protein